MPISSAARRRVFCEMPASSASRKTSLLGRAPLSSTSRRRAFACSLRVAHPPDLGGGDVFAVVPLCHSGFYSHPKGRGERADVAFHVDESLCAALRSHLVFRVRS